MLGFFSATGATIVAKRRVFPTAFCQKKFRIQFKILDMSDLFVLPNNASKTSGSRGVMHLPNWYIYFLPCYLVLA